MSDLSELADGTGSLVSIQTFDAASIARSGKLGEAFDFTPVVPVLVETIDFFRLIPKDLVPVLPEAQRRQVISHADNIWATIQGMLRFDPNSAGNPVAERQALIGQLSHQFGGAISELGAVLAYATARQRTSSGVEAELRAVVEEAKERSKEAARVERETGETVARMLSDVRGLAAEAGVSQEATHFGDQAGTHATAARTWQGYTNLMAGALVLFALITLWLGYSFEPKNAYQAVQVGLSKVLIFSTLAYLLFLCGRTLMAHRHNEIVNRHRQNALLTFNALTEAAGSEQTKDVVLTHASACIYAPQDSGFNKGGTSSSPTSLVEIIPRVVGEQGAV